MYAGVCMSIQEHMMCTCMYVAIIVIFEFLRCNPWYYIYTQGLNNNIIALHNYNIVPCLNEYNCACISQSCSYECTIHTLHAGLSAEQHGWCLGPGDTGQHWHHCHLHAWWSLGTHSTLLQSWAREEVRSVLHSGTVWKCTWVSVCHWWDAFQRYEWCAWCAAAKPMSCHYFAYELSNVVLLLYYILGQISKVFSWEQT